MDVLPLEAIKAAALRATPLVRRTPLLPLDQGIWLKLEVLQPTGSFKVRGFASAATALPPSRLARGLLTVSAGNAALACAYTARRLGVSCRVIMFDTAPVAKVEGVRRLGGEPVLKSRPALLEWMAGRCWEAEPELFIHPFRDEAVQAGHGGLGLEVAEQLPEVGRVVVAVGGGGLATGVAAALKQLKPGLEVVGVQSSGYPLWPRTFAQGEPPLDLTPQTLADGTSAPYDPYMHGCLEEAVDTWVTVPEEELEAAVRELAQRGKVVAEGAGALPYAALGQLDRALPTVAVISGGNIDPVVLARLLAAGA